MLECSSERFGEQPQVYPQIMFKQITCAHPSPSEEIDKWEKQRTGAVGNGATHKHCSGMGPALAGVCSFGEMCSSGRGLVWPELVYGQGT